MLLGDKIRELRKLKKLTQEDLANRSGISRVSIGNYERNDRTPDAITLVKIAKGLKIPVSDFFDIDELQTEEETLVAYFDLIEFVKGIGYYIVPYEFGDCELRSSKTKDGKVEYLVGCEDGLCVDCPKFVKSFKVTYKDKVEIISFENYNMFKNEIISFIKFKMNDIFKSD